MIFGASVSILAAQQDTGPAAQLPPLSPNSPVKIKADNSNYYNSIGVVIGEGNVIVEYPAGNVTVNSDYIEYEVDKNRLSAYGNVIIRDGVREIRADRVSYEFDRNYGESMDSAMDEPPFFYRGDQVETIPREGSEGQTDILVRRGVLTTSRFSYPPFRVEGNEVLVYPGEEVLINDALLYVGSTPLLYLPAYRVSLQPEREKLDIQPGQNNQEGFFLGIFWNYYLSANLFGTTHTELSQRNGWLGSYGLNYSLDALRPILSTGGRSFFDFSRDLQEWKVGLGGSSYSLNLLELPAPDKIVLFLEEGLANFLSPEEVGAGQEGEEEGKPSEPERPVDIGSGISFPGSGGFDVAFSRLGRITDPQAFDQVIVSWIDLVSANWNHGFNLLNDPLTTARVALGWNEGSEFLTPKGEKQFQDIVTAGNTPFITKEGLQSRSLTSQMSLTNNSPKGSPIGYTLGAAWERTEGYNSQKESLLLSEQLPRINLDFTRTSLLSSREHTMTLGGRLTYLRSHRAERFLEKGDLKREPLRSSLDPESQPELDPEIWVDQQKGELSLSYSPVLLDWLTTSYNYSLGLTRLDRSYWKSEDGGGNPIPEEMKRDLYSLTSNNSMSFSFELRRVFDLENVLLRHSIVPSTSVNYGPPTQRYPTFVTVDGERQGVDRSNLHNLNLPSDNPSGTHNVSMGISSNLRGKVVAEDGEEIRVGDLASVSVGSSFDWTKSRDRVIASTGARERPWSTIGANLTVNPIGSEAPPEFNTIGGGRVTGSLRVGTSIDPYGVEDKDGGDINFTQVSLTPSLGYTHQLWDSALSYNYGHSFIQGENTSNAITAGGGLWITGDLKLGVGMGFDFIKNDFSTQAYTLTHDLGSWTAIFKATRGAFGAQFGGAPLGSGIVFPVNPSPVWDFRLGVSLNAFPGQVQREERIGDFLPPEIIIR